MNEPDRTLSGRRCIVTGGASGIGLATATSLAARGARVLVIDRDSSAWRHVSQGLRDSAEFAELDITDETAVEAVIGDTAQRWDGLDAVFNVAGVVIDTNTDIRLVPFESWQRVIEINLTGAFLVSRAAARVMIPQGGGSIVLVGSQGGVTMPATSFPYGASKGGINGLAMSLAHALNPHGVRVLNVMPTTIDTPLLRSVVTATGGSMESALAATHSAVGLGEAIALLADPASAYLRGPLVTL